MHGRTTRERASGLMPSDVRRDRDAPRATSPDEPAVVLFTRTFPFGQGEEFLEAELPVLVREFETVILVPTLHAARMSQTRAIPSGVTLVTRDAAPARLRQSVIRFCLRNPITALGSAARAAMGAPRARHMGSEILFELNAAAVTSEIAATLARLTAGCRNVVVYAYWLHVPARVATMVRASLGPRPSVLSVSRANGFDLYTERHPHQYLPQRSLLLRELDRVFAASDFAEEYLRERYPQYAQKFSTARIGTTPAINAGNADRSIKHVVSCSYIAEVKRLPMLVSNIAEAQRRGVRVRWTHIGSGPAELVRAVTEQAERELLPGTFTFLGHLGSNELRAWYATHPASVFVHMSESEGGLAASIQEALAQGIPVIATAVGGVIALKQDKLLSEGLLEANHSPGQFADLLSTFLSDDDVYAQRSKASMAFWRAYCSAETLATALAQELRHLSLSTSSGDGEPGRSGGDA